MTSSVAFLGAVHADASAQQQPTQLMIERETGDLQAPPPNELQQEDDTLPLPIRNLPTWSGPLVRIDPDTGTPLLFGSNGGLPQLGGTLPEGQLVDGTMGSNAVAILAPPNSPLQDFAPGGLQPADRPCLDAAAAVGAANIPGKLRNRTSLSEPERALVDLMVAGCFSNDFKTGAGAEAKFIRDRAVILRRRYGERGERIDYCSGFLIANDRVATARHCLFLKNIPLEVASISISAPFSGSSDEPDWVPIAAEEGYTRDGVFVRPPTGPTEDLVTIRLARPLEPTILLTTAFATSAEIDAALNGADPLGAFFQIGFQKLASLLIAQDEDRTAFFRDSYLMDRSTYCVAITYTEKCVIQGCQSLQQSSGSALLMRTIDGIKLVGTLNGAGQDEDGLSPFPTCFPHALSSNQYKALRQMNITSRP